MAHLGGSLHLAAERRTQQPVADADNLVLKALWREGGGNNGGRVDGCGCAEGQAVDQDQ